MKSGRHPCAPFPELNGHRTLRLQGLSGKAGSAMSDKPSWARRITSEREARGWNKPQFIAALRAHAPSELPSKDSLLRRVHSWESGSSCPDDFYKPIIAAAFGTVTGAIWPVTSTRDADAEDRKSTR